MKDINKAINDLLQAHEAMLINVRLLVLSIDEIAPLAAKSTLSDDEIKLIRESLRNFGVALFYMNEGEITHENMDNDTLKSIISKDEQKDINNEHTKIKASIKQMQNELQNSDTWNAQQINQHLVNLKKHIRDFHDFVFRHATCENEMAKRGLTK